MSNEDEKPKITLVPTPVIYVLPDGSLTREKPETGYPDIQWYTVRHEPSEPGKPEPA